jgi:hypothetical protein
MKLINKILEKAVDFEPKTKRVESRYKKNLIIHHYCPHTFNAGDHFVIQSIRKHLKKYLPEAIFVPKAIAENRGWGKPIGLKGENILFSNEFADAVIIGGSDQYNNWSPRIREKEIVNLIPPLFLIGLGASSKDIDTPFNVHDKHKRDIIATNNKSVLSSVRDLATQEMLMELGCNNTIMTGCPALYLFDNPLVSKKGPVLLTFPYPLIRKTNNHEKSKLLLTVTSYLINRFSSMNIPTVIVCHDDRDVPFAQMMYPGQDIFFSNYANEYYDFYNNASLVIGSRLHASILASSLGTPSININLDMRGKAYSSAFCLSQWNLDYNDNDILTKLDARIKKVLDGDLNELIDFSKVRAHYKKVFDSFMMNTAEQIRSRAY